MAEEEVAMSISTAPGVFSSVFISAPALLDHWQGHRRLTRRVIDVFPDDQLFTFSLGSMRPFGAMALELISIAEPMVRGVLTGTWSTDRAAATSKSDILRLWDESTAAIDRQWPEISSERFQETLTAFGQYPGKAHDLVLYAIDNEIHHRGQGYVYLRALGIDPPAFYERQ
jgi:uncharacterized damage-inducible protein DinB